MVTGIYKIWINNPLKVYIGYASDLSNRKSKHFSMLNNGSHHSIKLQNAFDKYKVFNFEVIEYTNDLQSREVYWINQYNSYSSGYNMTEGGEGAPEGEHHHNALAVLDTYKNIVILLATTNNTAKEIATILDTSINVVQDIALGNTHTYLRNIMPEHYNNMLGKIGNKISGKSSAKERGIIYPKVYKVGEGIPTEVDNLSKFCRDNDLDNRALHRLLTYRAKSHKGWKRYE